MLRTFELLGVDAQGQLHKLSQRHNDIGNAAERALEQHHDYWVVLQGDRQARSRNNHYGKLIRQRKGVNLDSIKDALIQAQDIDLTARCDVAKMIIRKIEGKGYRLATVDVDESTEVRAIRTNGHTEELSDEDKKDIVLHNDTIIKVLSERPAPAVDVSVKKKGRRSKDEIQAVEMQNLEIFQSVLLELPDGRNFITYEFIQALNRKKQQEVADNDEKVYAILESAAKAGRLKKIKHGVFALIQRKLDPAESAAVEPLSNAPVATSALPESPPKAVEAPIPSMNPPVAQKISPASNFLEALLSTALCQGSIADALEGAFKEFQDANLESMLRLEQTIKPMIQRVREEECLRSKLRTRILDET